MGDAKISSGGGGGAGAVKEAVSSTPSKADNGNSTSVHKSEGAASLNTSDKAEIDPLNKPPGTDAEDKVFKDIKPMDIKKEDNETAQKTKEEYNKILKEIQDAKLGEYDKDGKWNQVYIDGQGKHFVEVDGDNVSIKTLDKDGNITSSLQTKLDTTDTKYTRGKDGSLVKDNTVKDKDGNIKEQAKTTVNPDGSTCVYKDGKCEFTPPKGKEDCNKDPEKCGKAKGGGGAGGASGAGGAGGGGGKKKNEKWDAIITADCLKAITEKQKYRNGKLGPAAMKLIQDAKKAQNAKAKLKPETKQLLSMTLKMLRIDTSVFKKASNQ